MKQQTTQLALLAALCGSAMGANIAGTGTGILGVHNTIDSTLGTPYVRGDQDITVISDGIYAVDGSFNSVGNANPDLVDTWNAPAGLEVTYMGVTGFSIPAGEAVSNVTVQLVAAGDGGWFGTPGIASTAAPDLVVPTLQTSSDGGTTWSDVPTTNDYLSVMTGAAFGSPNPNYHTVSFDMAGQTGIDGIRLIGPNAGFATGGFAGMSEFEVNTSVIPEPASMTLLGLGIFGLFRRNRN